jgi:ubiquitin-like protein Pup
MAQTTQSERSTRPSKEHSGPSAPSASLADKAKRLKGDLDRIVDEIDGILEQNGEEFVKSYVQRGGE